MADHRHRLRAGTRPISVALAVLAVAPAGAVAAGAAQRASHSHASTPTVGGQRPAAKAAVAGSRARSRPASTQTATVTQTATTTATTTTTTTTATRRRTRVPRLTVPLPLPRPAASPATLTGWLSSAAAFPARALVLAPAAGHSLSLVGTTLDENGGSVPAATLDPLTDPSSGDLGVMVALDAGASTAGDPLRAEMATARTLATGRARQLAFGALSYATSPQVIVNPTTDASNLRHALTGDPTPAPGAGITAAGLRAVDELTRAHFALGVAVVVSDGVGISASGTTIAAAAAAAHVPVVTIGLRDARSTGLSLRALRQWAPGEFELATPAQLSQTVAGTISAIERRYSVLRYESSAPTGTEVSVRVKASRMPGEVTATYRSPGPAPRPQRPRHAARSLSALAAQPPADRLSPTPSFAVGLPVSAVTSPPPAATGGFWHSGAAVLVVALLSGLLIGLMVLLVVRRPAQNAVRNRVGSYMPTESEATEGDGHADGHRRSGLLGALERGTWWPQFVEGVEVSRSLKSPGFLMKRAAVVAVVVAVLLALVSHIVALGLLPLLAFPFVQRWWVMRQATKQRERFGDSLPAYMQDIASAIRVGRSLVGALAVVADSAEEPTRSEFERAVTDEALGRPLDESLTAVGKRMHSTDMDQFALIAELNRRSGSNVAEALDRIAEGARDRADLRREMRALTAQAKMSSAVLTGMPFVLLLALSVIAPEYSHPLFHTLWGWISLVFAFVLIATGRKVMKKITNLGV